MTDNIDTFIFVLFLPCYPPTRGQVKIIRKILEDKRCKHLVIAPYAYALTELPSQRKLDTMFSLAFSEWHIPVFGGRVHISSGRVHKLSDNNHDFFTNTVISTKEDFVNTNVCCVFDIADLDRLGVNKDCLLFKNLGVQLIAYGNKQQIDAIANQPISSLFCDYYRFTCESSGNYQLIIQEMLKKEDYTVLAEFLPLSVYQYIAAIFEDPKDRTYILELGPNRGIAPSLCIKPKA